MLKSFLSRLTAPKPSALAEPPFLFSNARLLQQVQKASKKWLTLAIEQPVVVNGVKVHTYGTSFLSIPSEVHVKFSTERRLEFTGTTLIDELFEGLQDETMPALTLLVNETPRDGDWLLHEYASYYRSSLSTNLDIETHWRETLAKLRVFNQNLEMEMDLPNDWKEIIGLTGLLPSWDVVCAIDAAQVYEKDLDKDVPYLRKLVFVGQELDELQHEITKIASSMDLASSSHPAGVSLQTDLDALFGSQGGLTQETMAACRTGNMKVDTMLQKLCLDPEGLAHYFHVLGSHATSQSRAFQDGLGRKLARDHLATRLLSKAIRRETNEVERGSTVVVVADRDLVQPLRHELSIAN
ncbi:hypothetical protein HDU91_007144 [Kappamyces sp. JEL0680]|nr:hypothetical protein HDU91_007144 [Kappamyces sp. JEL0680]